MQQKRAEINFTRNAFKDRQNSAFKERVKGRREKSTVSLITGLFIFLERCKAQSADVRGESEGNKQDEHEDFAGAGIGELWLVLC